MLPASATSRLITARVLRRSLSPSARRRGRAGPYLLDQPSFPNCRSGLRSDPDKLPCRSAINAVLRVHRRSCLQPPLPVRGRSALTTYAARCRQIEAANASEAGGFAEPGQLPAPAPRSSKGGRGIHQRQCLLRRPGGIEVARVRPICSPQQAGRDVGRSPAYRQRRHRPRPTCREMRSAPAELRSRSCRARKQH